MYRRTETVALRLAWVAFWLLLAAFFTTRTLQRSGAAIDDPGAWAAAAIWNVPSVLLFGLLAIAIERFRRRFPFEGARRPVLYLHAAASILVAPLHLGLLDFGFTAAERWLHRPLGAHDLSDSLPRLFHLDVLLYWLVVLGGEALEQGRRSRHEQLMLARLETQLAEARLAALRMQLQPHFLFNTLNSIVELIHIDVAAADRMLSRLEDLLSTALHASSEHEIELAEELRFLERYLEVERVRFRDRLAVRFEIEPATLGERVPALVLQPLVENALRHGIGRLSRGGEIVVRAALGGGLLRLEVENDAPRADSRPNATHRGAGVGLANTSERLGQLYGDDARLETRFVDEDGRFHARISIARGAEEAKTARASFRWTVAAAAVRVTRGAA